MANKSEYLYTWLTVEVYLAIKQILKERYIIFKNLNSNKKLRFTRNLYCNTISTTTWYTNIRNSITNNLNYQIINY